MGVGSGFFYGLFLLWLRRVRYADPIAITFANCIGVAVLFSFALFNRDVDAEDLALLFVMGAVQFALPYLLFTRGLREVESSEASLWRSSSPSSTRSGSRSSTVRIRATATIAAGRSSSPAWRSATPFCEIRAPARTQQVETPRHPAIVSG